MITTRKTDYLFKATLFLTFAALMALPEDALAWGIGAHMDIAKKTASSLFGCLGQNSYAAAAVKHFGAFLAGSLAPDMFVLKDWFLKPSKVILHNWELAHRLLRNAREDEEVAFGLGYVSHLSSDVICHNFFIPQYIFMWDHRLKFTHVFAETQVEGHLGKTFEADRINMIMRESRCLNSFFVRTAGLDRKTFERNRVLIGKAISFKQKTGIDGSVLRWSANNGKDFIERADEHLRLSLELSVQAVKNPFNSNALRYCPEGEMRINLSRLRRKASMKVKKPEAFRKEREAGKYNYIHRVPRHLVTEPVL